MPPQNRKRECIVPDCHTTGNPRWGRRCATHRIECEHEGCDWYVDVAHSTFCSDHPRPALKTVPEPRRRRTKEDADRRREAKRRMIRECRLTIERQGERIRQLESENKTRGRLVLSLRAEIAELLDNKAHETDSEGFITDGEDFPHSQDSYNPDE